MHAQHVERDRVQIDQDAQKGLGISPGSRAMLKRWPSVPVCAWDYVLYMEHDFCQMWY